MRRKVHVRCGPGEKMEIISKSYLSVSHAAVYAAISVQTAYLKANYPLEFAVGLLSSVMDASKKLMKYVTTYRKSGITILPPDVNYSMYNFAIETDKDGHDCIRFGLFALNGVGAEIAKTIPVEREKRPYTNLDDFISRHLTVNKQALDSMAKAGALDSFGYTRHTLLENLGDMLTEIRTKNKKQDKNQLTLFDFGLEEIKIPRTLVEQPEYGFLKRCQLEKDATGMYISGHPAELIQETAKKNGAISIAEIIEPNSKVVTEARVSIAGVITELTRKVTKNGTPMVRMMVEDTTGSIMVLAFSYAIQKYGTELAEDGLVLLTGKIRGDEEDRILILDSACRFKDIASTLWIGTSDTSLITLRKMAMKFWKKHPGIGDRLLICSTKTKEIKYIGDIAINPETLNEARVWFKNQNIEVTQKSRT